MESLMSQRPYAPFINSIAYHFISLYHKRPNSVIPVTNSYFTTNVKTCMDKGVDFITSFHDVSEGYLGKKVSRLEFTGILFKAAALTLIEIGTRDIVRYSVGRLIINQFIRPLTLKLNEDAPEGPDNPWGADKENGGHYKN